MRVRRAVLGVRPGIFDRKRRRVKRRAGGERHQHKTVLQQRRRRGVEHDSRLYRIVNRRRGEDKPLAGRQPVVVHRHALRIARQGFDASAEAAGQLQMEPARLQIIACLVIVGTVGDLTVEVCRVLKLKRLDGRIFAVLVVNLEVYRGCRVSGDFGSDFCENRTYRIEPKFQTRSGFDLHPALEYRRWGDWRAGRIEEYPAAGSDKRRDGEGMQGAIYGDIYLAAGLKRKRLSGKGL